MFVRATAVLLAGVVVAACSSGSGPSTSAPASPSTVPTTVQPTVEVSRLDPFADLDPLAAWTFEPGRTDALGAMVASTDSTSPHEGGSSVYFDGEADYFQVVSHTDPGADELKPTGALTVAFWYRVESGPSDGDHDYLARWRWYGWGVRLTGDSIFADVWHSVADAGPVQLSLEGPAIDGGWHHLALTFDGMQDRLYIDGVVVAEASADGQLHYQAVAAEGDCCGSGGALGFGRDADVDGNYFAGWLDDIALFDRALDVDAIAELAAR